MRTLKRYIPDLVALLLFILISAAYFFPADTEGRILFQHDASAGTGAGQEALEYYQDTGRRTRWTNSLFGGMPTYQISPSYDSTDGLKIAQDAYHLWLPDYVWYTFVLLLGFYILLRAFGMSAWLSGLGAIMWAFSSYFFILISAGHIWKLVTLAYIPPTIAGMVLAYRGRLLQGGLVFAIFVAFQVLSNHVQMSYYFLFVMLFMVLAFLAEALRKHQMPQFWKSTAVLLVAGLIGVATNISNLYHTYEYSKQTMRGPGELVEENTGAKASGGLDADYITQWSYGIEETLTLLVPNAKGGASVPLSQSETAMLKANPQYGSLYGMLTQYFGDQPMTSGPVYVGAFVLFLFVLGCFVVKGPMKWALLGATVFSIVLSWGKNFMGPTSFFIDFVPMYNKFRAVSSILVIAEFTIPLLAMLALKRIVEQPRLFTENLKAVCVSLALTMGVALLMGIAPGAFTSFVPQQEMQMLQEAVDQGGIPASELDGIVVSLSDMRRALTVADALRSAVIIGVGFVLLWLFVTGKLRKEFAVVGIALLCLGDMWTVNKRYLNDDQFVSKDVRTTAFVQSAADKQILQDTDPDYRVLNFGRSTFNENNTSYWHKSVGGYHAAKLRRYQELIEHHIMPQMSRLYSAVAQSGGDMDSLDASQFQVLNMLNTRYLIFGQGDNAVALRNPYAMGNAWFVDQVQYVDNANQEIDALDTADLRHTAVVDRRFASVLNNADVLQHGSDASLTLETYEPNRLVYTSDNAADGVAVFSEIYYPDGWQVTIDREPATLGRADYVLRTLYLPAGKHTIEMSFDPQSLHVTEGIAYTALGVLAVAAVVVLMLLLRRRKT